MKGGRKTIWLAKTFLVASRTEALLLQARDWNGASYMEMWRNENRAKHFKLESTRVEWTNGQFYSWWLGTVADTTKTKPKAIIVYKVIRKLKINQESTGTSAVCIHIRR